MFLPFKHKIEYLESLQRKGTDMNWSLDSNKEKYLKLKVLNLYKMEIKR